MDCPNVHPELVIRFERHKSVFKRQLNGMVDDLFGFLLDEISAVATTNISSSDTKVPATVSTLPSTVGLVTETVRIPSTTISLTTKPPTQKPQQQSILFKQEPLDESVEVKFVPLLPTASSGTNGIAAVSSLTHLDPYDDDDNHDQIAFTNGLESHHEDCLCLVCMNDDVMFVGEIESVGPPPAKRLRPENPLPKDENDEDDTPLGNGFFAALPGDVELQYGDEDDDYFGEDDTQDSHFYADEEEEDNLDDQQLNPGTSKKTSTKCRSSGSGNISKPVFKINVVGLNCPSCAKMCKSRKELNQHLLSQHGLYPHACRVDGCGLTFPHGFALSAHIKEHHSNLTKFLCVPCGLERKRIFRDHRALYDHQLRHHEPGRFGCSFTGCRFTANCRELVRTHFRNHAEYNRAKVSVRSKAATVIDSRERPFRCMFCGATFIQYGFACQHVRVTHFGDVRKRSKKNRSKDQQEEDDRHPYEFIERVDQGVNEA